MKAIFSVESSGLENQFLDKGGNAPVAHHAEPESFSEPGHRRRPRPHVQVEASVPVLQRIGGESAADRRARGRSVHQMKAPIMLGALDDVVLDQAVGQMGVAVGAAAVGGVKFSRRVAISANVFLP